MSNEMKDAALNYLADGLKVFAVRVNAPRVSSMQQYSTVSEVNTLFAERPDTNIAIGHSGLWVMTSWPNTQSYITADPLRHAPNTPTIISGEFMHCLFNTQPTRQFGPSNKKTDPPNWKDDEDRNVNFSNTMRHPLIVPPSVIRMPNGNRRPKWDIPWSWGAVLAWEDWA
jgi:hypothetical protein